MVIDDSISQDSVIVNKKQWVISIQSPYGSNTAGPSHHCVPLDPGMSPHLPTLPVHLMLMDKCMLINHHMLTSRRAGWAFGHHPTSTDHHMSMDQRMPMEHRTAIDHRAPTDHHAPRTIVCWWITARRWTIVRHHFTICHRPVVCCGTTVHHLIMMLLASCCSHWAESHPSTSRTLHRWLGMSSLCPYAKHQQQVTCYLKSCERVEN